MAGDDVSRQSDQRFPIQPNRPVLVVVGNSCEEVDSESLNAQDVGKKALGLAAIPESWTRPFFVVSSRSTPTRRALQEALRRAGIKTDRLLVRSSGVDESIGTRGQLPSFECSRESLPQYIVSAGTAAECWDGSAVHWVVQELIPAVVKGHLSNERRLSRVARDWICEVEGTSRSDSEVHGIAIRRWRDAREPTLAPLDCPFRANYIERLEDVARWSQHLGVRLHFEWVWSGERIFLVQLDKDNSGEDGTDPGATDRKHLVQAPRTSLSSFRPVLDSDFSTYRKLANAKLYRELGYQMPEFYLLTDSAEIRNIVEEGQCSGNLLDDLAELTRWPLVIRTDGIDIPTDQRSMLPRSDELRTVDAAVEWLTEHFAPKVVEGGIDSCALCLVAHHFIPAVASAWSQAYPDHRRVRIESLWGIPEGLYWYAYDSFDVDTKAATTGGEIPFGDCRINEKVRYKGKFVAPDKSGAWVVHSTKAGPDWARSIKRDAWIEEIAWISRAIADREKQPVVIMWFVDIPSGVTEHRVIPWYHERWERPTGDVRAAPRKHILPRDAFTIKSVEDWHELRRRTEVGPIPARVLIDPTEPGLVREPTFAKELAALARDFSFVVELRGGILSHAFYLLESQGCAVEVADFDLYSTKDEELEFHKIVRDKIPERIVGGLENARVIRLEKEALILGLKKKVVEEAFEAFDARNTAELTEELADLREVVEALQRRLAIDENDVVQCQRRKAEKSGGFDRGVMLVKTGIPSPFGPQPDDRQLFEQEAPSVDESGIVSRAEYLSRNSVSVHTDRRELHNGQREVHAEIELRAYDDYTCGRATIPSIHDSDRIRRGELEIVGQRIGTAIRVKVRIRTMPEQLELCF